MKRITERRLPAGRCAASLAARIMVQARRLAAAVPAGKLPALLALLLAAGCATDRVLFDDFSYDSPQQLARNQWIVRTAPGWPGVAGALWGMDSVSMVSDTGQKAIRMIAFTDGTTTRQAQICHQRKFREGTYAARVRFSDQPDAGPTGDQIVQSAYLIAPLKSDLDPSYSETDFEYLPNGGWGRNAATMFVTTWATFRLEPWKADNASVNVPGPFGGWHTLVLQIANGQTRYFVDGRALAGHAGHFYPESLMAISFNLWFVRGGTIASSEMRRWTEDIDWVYFRAGKVESPGEVDAMVSQMRSGKIAFRDTIPASGLDSPCNF